MRTRLPVAAAGISNLVQQSSKVRTEVLHKVRGRRTPSPRHYYANPIEVSDFHISLLVGKDTDVLRCALIIEDDAGVFETFYAQQDKIESEIGTELDWQGPTETSSGRQQSQINATRGVTIFEHEEQWEEYQERVIDMGERFHEAFGPRTEKL